MSKNINYLKERECIGKRQRKEEAEIAERETDEEVQRDTERKREKKCKKEGYTEKKKQRKER